MKKIRTNLLIELTHRRYLGDLKIIDSVELLDNFYGAVVKAAKSSKLPYNNFSLYWEDLLGLAVELRSVKIVQKVIGCVDDEALTKIYPKLIEAEIKNGFIESWDMIEWFTLRCHTIVPKELTEQLKYATDYNIVPLALQYIRLSGSLRNINDKTLKRLSKMVLPLSEAINAELVRREMNYDGDEYSINYNLIKLVRTIMEPTKPKNAKIRKKVESCDGCS